MRAGWSLLEGELMLDFKVQVEFEEMEKYFLQKNELFIHPLIWRKFSLFLSFISLYFFHCFSFKTCLHTLTLSFGKINISISVEWLDLAFYLAQIGLQ